MIRGFALVGILLLLSGGMAEARLPQAGDGVSIELRDGLRVETFVGNVTNVTDDLLCMDCDRPTGDFCFGTSFIYRIGWFD